MGVARKGDNMKAEALKVKVQKAEEAVAKRQATLERQIKTESKRREALIAKGIDIYREGIRRELAQLPTQELFWEYTDWEHSVEAVENSQQVLQEKIRIAGTWKDRLTEAQKKENLWITEIPESMKSMQAELVARWDEYDMKRRDELRVKYQEMGYLKFFAEYSLSLYNLINSTDKEIHTENVRAAESLILNLYSRIHAITGEVTDWANIYFSGGALNGIVKGKLGTVKVESILAGGYNIQRLHVRVLVHEIKQ